VLPKDFAPQAYDALLNEKISAIAPRFNALGAPSPKVFASSRASFRMRTEFRVWHDGDSLDFVMFDREAPKVPVPIATFPIASEAIQGIFTPLKEALKASPELKRKLFQVEFLSTQSGQVLVTLIYHRQLDETWEQAGQLLSEQLNILLIGRSRGQKITLKIG
jgi:tRNA (uracil-5-)-methyltransferase